MTEATTHNQLGRLIFLLVSFTYILSPCFIEAQSIQPDTRLSQLLDSAEVLKLKGDIDLANQLCQVVKQEDEIV